MIRHRNSLRLKIPHNFPIRPTLSKIRAAIFDVLQTYLDFKQSLFIDLFAGSGAVSIEAAQRGFKKLVLIEKDPRVFKYLKTNRHLLGQAEADIINTDSYWWLKKPLSEDLTLNKGVIFADPPFLLSYYEKLSQLKQLGQFTNWWLVLQIPQTMPVLINPCLNNLKTKVYGKNSLYFFKINRYPA